MSNQGDWPGRFIHSTVALFTSALMILGFLFLVKNGIYGYVYVPGIGRAIIHSISLLSLTGAFLMFYIALDWMFPLVRAIICLCITVFSIQLYDFTWSIFSQAVRGTGFSWVATLAVVTCLILLERFDNKHGIIRREKWWSVRRIIFIIFWAIFILSFRGMIGSGFYQSMALYDKGLGTDPNVGNIFWMIGKVIVFWLFLPLIDVRDYKAPLKLDPRVLIW